MTASTARRIGVPLAGAAIAAGALTFAGAASASADTVAYGPERVVKPVDDLFNPTDVLIANDGSLRIGGEYHDQEFAWVWSSPAGGTAARRVLGVTDIVGSWPLLGTDAAGHLYVGDNRDLRVYRESSARPALVRRLEVGGGAMWAAAPDGRVANLVPEGTEGRQEIDIFAPGASGRARAEATVVSQRGWTLMPVAFDRRGNLWALETDRRQQANLVKFAAGIRTGDHPVQRISGNRSGLTTQSQAYATDDEGRTYVLDEAKRTVSAFAAGATGNAAPLRVLRLPYWPTAFDVRGDEIAVAQSGHTASTYVYRTLFPTKASPVRSLRVTGKKKAKKRTVRWAKPADDGGRSVRGYKIIVRKGTKVVYRDTVGSDRRKKTIKRSSLRAGKLTVTVRAKTAVGYGKKATATFRVKK